MLQEESLVLRNAGIVEDLEKLRKKSSVLIVMVLERFQVGYHVQTVVGMEKLRVHVMQLIIIQVVVLFIIAQLVQFRHSMDMYVPHVMVGVISGEYNVQLATDMAILLVVHVMKLDILKKIVLIALDKVLI